ncbi:MAG: hypothetical protein ABI690_31915 [Chloroflexota bacterium]
MAKINAEKIPPEIRPFIPYAEKYGDEDVGIRKGLVETATVEELHELAAIWEFCIGLISDWLAKPEARAESTTDEYIAFTCLILAVDRARHRLDDLLK